MRVKLKEVKATLRQRRHQSTPELGKWLGQVVRGFINYHAVKSNYKAKVAFRCRVTSHWRRALIRRGGRDRTTWQRIEEIADDYLPKVQIIHPWPEQRIAVRHPRWEPYAGKPHVRICAGGAQ